MGRIDACKRRGRYEQGEIGCREAEESGEHDSFAGNAAVLQHGGKEKAGHGDKQDDSIGVPEGIFLMRFACKKRLKHGNAEQGEDEQRCGQRGGGKRSRIGAIRLHEACRNSVKKRSCEHSP